MEVGAKIAYPPPTLPWRPRLGEGEVM